MQCSNVNSTCSRDGYNGYDRGVDICSHESLLTLALAAQCIGIGPGLHRLLDCISSEGQIFNSKVKVQVERNLLF